MPETTQLTFPCIFPIKVMGKMDFEFEAEVVCIVNKHVPDLPEGAIKMNKSKSGNYLAITITFEAQSREQLDKLYTDLTACKKVIMAL